MRITDYPSVDSLTDNDVILIDGNNGTKKLTGEYIKQIHNAIERYEDPSDGLIPNLESSIDTMTVSGRKYIGSGTYGGPENNWGIVEAFVYKNGNIIQKWTGFESDAVYMRRRRDTVWSEWYRIDSQNMFCKPWKANESVNVNYFRYYKNVVYKCILAHTTSDSLTPDNTTYWEKKTGGICNEIWQMKNSFQAGVDTVYNACVNKGQTPSSSTPSAIASAIAALVKPSGTKSITANGTYDVTSFASASVAVPSTVYHSIAQFTGKSTNRWYKYVIIMNTSLKGGTLMGMYNLGGMDDYYIYRDVPSGTGTQNNTNRTMIGIY